MILHPIPADHPEPDPADLAGITTRLAAIEAKLQNPPDDGTGVAEWEAFWTDLLATYEEIHARLATLQEGDTDA